MKKSSRILTLLLVAVMLFSLASCSKNNDTTNPTSTPAETGAPATTVPTQSSEPQTDSREIKLPLSDSPVSFRGWQIFIGGLYGMTDPNDVRAYQEYEKQTNIHIDWQTATFMDATTNFNLSIASGDWPDFYMTNPASGSRCLYIGGYDKYINDGVIIDLTPYMEKFAPNYTFWRTQSDTVARMTTTESGKIAYFRNVSKEREPTWAGFAARQDWLDSSNIKANDVVTYDQFHKLLTAVKDKANVAPLTLGSTTGIVEKLSVGYDCVNGYSNINGVVTFGPITDGWKAYLQMMTQWYQEGLFDPNFTTQDAQVQAKVYNGDFGVTGLAYTNIDLYDRSSGDGANWVTVKAPLKTADSKRYQAYDGIPETPLGGANMTVTTSCENPELLCQWADYGYTDEGSLLGSYGIEGESYEILPDGKPQFLKEIYGSDQYGQLQAQFRLGPMNPHLYDWRANILPNFGDKAKSAGSVWDSNYEEKYTMPGVSVGEDVAGDYSAIMGDITTYIEESTPKFILGQLNFNADWDNYITTIKNLGIDNATQYMQDALDAYLSK